MPCSIPATSVSSRHRVNSLSSPPRGMPTPSALLDLTKAGERRVEAFMRWAATCTPPLWLPLAVRRRKKVLVVAVEWRAWPHSHDRPLGLVELSLSGESICWQSFGRRQKDRVLAMVADGERTHHSSQRFGDILRQRRESAGLTQTELASAAKLSTTTIANLESGRNTPAALTVASLRSVAALKLGVALPQYAEPQSVAQR